MDGQDIIKKLTRLGDVTSIKDVKQLTNSLFPGSHCPLMGAALVLKGVEDALFMVIGTDECTYYTKSFASGSAFGGITGRCISFVLENNDVTFGSVNQIETAFKQVYEEYKPKAVFLISTCVIEIIGDDIESLARKLTDEYDLPVMSVQTEHFKSVDHIPGIERTMAACIQMMTAQPKDETVNVLGQRLGDFKNTELYDILTKSGIEIGLMLPSGCTINEIEVAAKAKVNIVVNETALPLAKKMKQKFKVPYVTFERYINPNQTLEAYEQLFNYLDKNLPAIINEKYEHSLKQIEDKKELFKSVRYIYGNTPYRNFELNEFLVSLGMEPLLIQVSALKDGDRQHITKILEASNPYVAKSANIVPLQYVYDVLKPDLYFGHEYAMRLRKKGIAVVALDGGNEKLGFEATDFMLIRMADAVDRSIQYKEEVKSNGVM